jgi:pterin-4a-carbinolamine dehydratase
METLIKLYEDFLFESLDKELEFTEFAKARLAGATKIAEEAKKKGGPAMLTHYHFVVKLPYYKKAASGKFDQDKAMAEMNKKVAELEKGGVDLQQIKFQKIVGIIEVLGELLIRFKS